jgi:hypothetical protein
MSPCMLTPSGIIDAARSYFSSLGSLIGFVVGFLGKTYVLGKFNGYDASTLGVSSYTTTDAHLVHGFFSCDAYAHLFGGTMEL